jgi:hypothetical protein
MLRMQVSRRDARVVFPRDTARQWGWSAKSPVSHAPAYAWGVWMVGPY